MKTFTLSRIRVQRITTHSIVGLIALQVLPSFYPNNQWNFYMALTFVSAFYIHSLFLLPILTKRRLKKYLIFTIIGFLIVAWTFNGFEAMRSSEFLIDSNGNNVSPVSLFFKPEWIFGVLLVGLIVFIPFFFFSMLYHILIINKQQRTQIFSYKYTEIIVNVIVIVSLLFMTAVSSRDFMNDGVRSLSQLLLAIGVFYINTFVLVQKLLKTKNGIVYLVSVLLLFVIYLGGHYSIHGNIYLEAIKESHNFIPTLVFFSFIILFSFIYGYVRTKLKANERLFDLKLNAKESELQLLKSQVNPHFLFNTLNTLYSTALKENAPKTAQSVAKLASLVRYMQNDINKEFIPLQNEIDYLEDYMLIQKLRLAVTPEIITKFEVDESIEISPGLFIPLVENAFKYGIHPTEKSTIVISLIGKENEIYFSCQNKYDDTIKIHKMNEGFGIGIENVQKRLALVYPQQHTFEILKENDTFSVQLTISTKNL